MSVAIQLLFVEKKVEAVRLCAALTEPFATGTVPGHEAELVKDYQQIVSSLKSALDELIACKNALGSDKTLDFGDVRHAEGRVQTVLGEIARGAQDFAAQARFFLAMNPDHAATTSALVAEFEKMDRATRDLQGDQPEDGDELAPAEESAVAPPPAGEADDPMLM